MQPKMTARQFRAYAKERIEADRLEPGDPAALAYLESIGQTRLDGFDPGPDTEKVARALKLEKAQACLF